MAIIIQGINSPVGTDSSEIIGTALKKAGIKKAVQTGIHKISLDARKQNDIKTVSSVWAELESRAEEEKICSLKDFCTYVDITPFEPKITGSISLRDVSPCAASDLRECLRLSFLRKWATVRWCWSVALMWITAAGLSPISGMGESFRPKQTFSSARAAQAHFPTESSPHA